MTPGYIGGEEIGEPGRDRGACVGGVGIDPQPDVDRERLGREDDDGGGDGTARDQAVPSTAGISLAGRQDNGRPSSTKVTPTVAAPIQPGNTHARVTSGTSSAQRS